mgnify:CR=1 FL=1
MAEEVSVSTTPKKRGRPPKNKVAETNSVTQTNQDVSREFCSMNSMIANQDKC